MQRRYLLGLACLSASFRLGLGLIVTRVDQAQSRLICNRNNSYEPDSSSTRFLNFPAFGIRITIPSNYRTMLMQDGSIEILHPDDFAWIQCLAQGGIGGGGYYSETISIAQRDPTMSLYDQAMWSVGYSSSRDGTRSPSATSVTPYRQGGFDGYVVTKIERSSAVFLGTISGSDHLLRIYASCDCEVEVADVIDLLSRIEPLR